MSAHNFKDLTGEKFQYLFVSSRAENAVSKSGKIKARWNCTCDCGEVCIKSTSDLRHKTKVISCGCKTKPKPIYDLTGMEVGFLTVLYQTENKSGSSRSLLWASQCECGNIVEVSSAMLRAGDKKSCGCKTKAETSGSHGMYRTPTWISWNSMIERCTKEHHKSYDRYSKVEIDPKWLESFENFFIDMGERPNDMTLDRIDNNLGYSKENCRWATRTTQQQNKRPNYINKNKGLAGVGTCGKKFAARIKHNGVREYLGSFDTPEEANEAYNKRGYEIFGDLWVYKGAPIEQQENLNASVLGSKG